MNLMYLEIKTEIRYTYEFVIHFFHLILDALKFIDLIHLGVPFLKLNRFM